MRSARQTARTIDVRAVLRHSVPNKGLHPLRLRLVYTVTGSYDGVETLDKKMERIMGEKFTEKMEDSE